MGKRVRAVIEVEVCESSKLSICAFVRGRSIGNVQKDCNDFSKMVLLEKSYPLAFVRGVQILAASCIIRPHGQLFCYSMVW